MMPTLLEVLSEIDPDSVVCGDIYATFRAHGYSHEQAMLEVEIDRALRDHHDIATAQECAEHGGDQ